MVGICNLINNKQIGKKILVTQIVCSLLLLPWLGVLYISSTTHEEQSVAYAKKYVFNPNAEEELVIYTHDSFLAWGADPEATHQKAFYDFGEENNVTVTLFLFNGMVEAMNTLIGQKNNPQADIVIGLDSSMVARAKDQKILQPYSSANLENISQSLITALDPEKYLLPVDYGLIALVFDTAFISKTTSPELSSLNFSTLLSSFGKDLAIPDPTLSATGLNFLLYQIIFYEQVLGLPWQNWWEQARDLVTITKSWSDAWSQVFSNQQDHMLVSYGTDPAYNDFFGYGSEENAEIIHAANDSAFGWMQIEGVGIVNGSSNVPLAKKYIDYLLSTEIQDLLPTNNWMFPANNQSILPPCYDYAISTENVTVLNYQVTSEYIGNNYVQWLNAWEQIIYGRNTWWIYVLIGTVALIIASTVIYFVYRKKTRIDVD